MNIQEKLQQRFTHPNTPYSAYPFDLIEDEDFPLLIDEAIRLQREEVDAITNNSESPSFDNTILAFENAGEALDALLGAFYNLLSAAGNDTLMAIAEDISPKLSRLSSDISLSEPLFQRIKAVYDQRESLALLPEEARLLYRQYKAFERGGALLNEEKKSRLREVNEQLSLSTLTFGNNLLKDTKFFRYFLPLDTESLEALPKELLSHTRQRAKKERNLSGHLFTLDAPEYSSIMRFCADEAIRRDFYFAKMQLSYGSNSYNNAYLVRQIANLRLEKAQLLGYSTYADYALEERMLNKPIKVMELLEQLEAASENKSRDELAAAAQIKGANAKLEAWDVNFFLERLKERDYNFSEEELRPYFPLNSVINGVLGLAEKLYDLTFSPVEDIPVYAEDVKVFRVDDPNGKGFIGLLYLDFFPRDGKRSGAWMNNLREEKEGKRPHILLVMNFSPPTEGQEALLLPGEVHTFLHEFGHALHGLLTQCRFQSLSGTNVVRDFVELPSQINENWLLENEFISLFARHFQTKESLPAELLERFTKAALFRTGYDTQRQLAFGFLDMAFHTLSEPLGEDWSAEAFEGSTFKKTPGFGTLPSGCLMSTSFSHLFAGGYAAGYYGYKWSEVLSTDAYSLFIERGIFDKETAARFREEILEKGDSEEAAVLYRRFRGRDPQIDALIARDALY